MHRVILGMRASSAARLNGVTTYVGDVGWSRQAHPPPGSRGHGNWQGENRSVRDCGPADEQSPVEFTGPRPAGLLAAVYRASVDVGRRRVLKGRCYTPPPSSAPFTRTEAIQLRRVSLSAVNRKPTPQRVPSVESAKLSNTTTIFSFSTPPSCVLEIDSSRSARKTVNTRS